MHLIFKFDSEESAKEVFTDVGFVLEDERVKFSGFISYPVDFGDEYTSSYFVIIKTDDLDIPDDLLSHEYNYQYPVAESVDLN